MKKIMMILAALVLLLSAAYAKENDLLARIRQKGEIVVATEGAWAPWTYHDENDQLVGFDVEVAQGVAAKLGVTAKFVENAEPTSAFGTKALGEPPACSGAPAIRNAIYNATGVAIDQNPINPHILFKRFSEEGLIQD